MKAVVNWLTECQFSYLEAVALLVAVTSTQHWPFWATLLVVVGAGMLTFLVSAILRHIVHLPSQRRVRT